jgi:hypothetical protein
MIIDIQRVQLRGPCTHRIEISAHTYDDLVAWCKQENFPCTLIKPASVIYIHESMLPFFMLKWS